jgi:hypothetical protein
MNENNTIRNYQERVKGKEVGEIYSAEMGASPSARTFCPLASALRKVKYQKGFAYHASVCHSNRQQQQLRTTEELYIHDRQKLVENSKS